MTPVRAALCILIAALVMGAAEMPLPRQKPALDAVTDEGPVPIPRPKPGRGIVGEEKPERPGGEGTGWSAAAAAKARRECRAALGEVDIVYRELDPIGEENGCGAIAPIELVKVAGVRIEPPAQLNCAMAAALHGWVTEVVQPAARAKLKTDVTIIRNAASYMCRARNNIKGSKLSEHAKASALDMAGFSFAGKDGAAVGDGWGGFSQALGVSRAGSFLETVRNGACGHFTTVLGPGSDSFHGNHFHVDAIHRKNGGKICK